MVATIASATGTARMPAQGSCGPVVTISVSPPGVHGRARRQDRGRRLDGKLHHTGCPAESRPRVPPALLLRDTGRPSLPANTASAAYYSLLFFLAPHATALVASSKVTNAIWQAWQRQYPRRDRHDPMQLIGCIDDGKTDVFPISRPEKPRICEGSPGGFNSGGRSAVSVPARSFPTNAS